MTVLPGARPIPSGVAQWWVLTKRLIAPTWRNGEVAVAQAIGIATLLRSVAYDRWITVLVSALLIGGTMAAQRGRTWGVALAFAPAVVKSARG